MALPQSSQSNNEYAYALTRYTAAYNPTYYRVGVGQGRSGNVFIRAQRNDGTTITPDVQTSIPAAPGVVVLLHVQAQRTNPTTLRARAWPAGTAEPTSWQLQATDGTAAAQRAGMVGLRLRNEDTSATHLFQLQSYQVAGSATAVSVTPNPSGPAHWLYVVTDGTVYAYDIDHGHPLATHWPGSSPSRRPANVA